MFFPSTDQSVLALYGKIVFFATLLRSVFKLIQGTYSPTFLEALVLALEYIREFFFLMNSLKSSLLTFFDLTGSVLPFSIGAINCFNLLENVFTEIFIFIMALFRLR